MQSLATRAKSKLYDPTALYGFLNSATKSLTADTDLAGLKQLYGLASSVKGIATDRISFLTVPNYPRQRDVPTDKANVTWQQPAARQLFTALNHDQEMTKEDLKKATAHLPAPAGSVHVTVLNSTSTQGAGLKVADQLRALGFQFTATGNAAPRRQDHAHLPPGTGGTGPGARRPPPRPDTHAVRPGSHSHRHLDHRPRPAACRGLSHSTPPEEPHPHEQRGQPAAVTDTGARTPARRRTHHGHRRLRRGSGPCRRGPSSHPRLRQRDMAHLRTARLARHSAEAQLVSELLTNACHHAPGRCLLTLTATPQTLEVTVWDSNPVPPTVHHTGADRGGQYGMEIVTALCHTVHTESESFGKRVTAVMAPAGTGRTDQAQIPQ